MIHEFSAGSLLSGFLCVAALHTWVRNPDMHLPRKSRSFAGSALPSPPPSTSLSVLPNMLPNAKLHCAALALLLAPLPLCPPTQCTIIAARPLQPLHKL